MRLRWEPFDAGRIGFDEISSMLSDFYADPPWNEYRKCVSCSSFDDFGPRGAFGRSEIESRRLDSCPACGRVLIPYWSSKRVREYISQLERKGRLLGIAIYDGDSPAGWVWGYELPEDNGSPYGPGAGMYIDVICIQPAYRNGVVAWYLILTLLKDLLERRYSFLVSRTHTGAENVRTLFRRLGFEELRPSDTDPDRTYWWRRLDSVSPAILKDNFEALTRAASRSSPANTSGRR